MERLKTMTREALKAKIDRGDDFVLLEVLSDQAYQRAHLPGAIPFQNMGRTSELLPDKDAEVVAYCSNFH